jgi:hypothetical protein
MRPAYKKKLSHGEVMAEGILIRKLRVEMYGQPNSKLRNGGLLSFGVKAQLRAFMSKTQRRKFRMKTKR